MTNYQFYDPLEARLSGDYRYGGVVFSGPKDVDFTYQFDLDDFGYPDSYGTSDLRDYISSGGY